MTAPQEVTVWIGLDVGKEEHFADVLDDAGESLLARSITNDETALEALLDDASGHGVAGLVIDQPGSIAQLTIAVANQRQVPIAYIPGLVMRRAADLYPGEAKTDRIDAFVIADTARTRRTKVHWLDTRSDDLLDQLRVLMGSTSTSLPISPDSRTGSVTCSFRCHQHWNEPLGPGCTRPVSVP